MDPTDSAFGATPPAPTTPGQAPPGPLSGFIGHAPRASLVGTALSGLLGVPGLGVVGGLFGSISDVARAEEALAEEYGARPPGYGRVGYEPTLSTWGAFLDAISPFSILGEGVAEQIADEISHMSVAGLEDIGYGGYGVLADSFADMAAAEAQGADEAAAEAAAASVMGMEGGGVGDVGGLGDFGGGGESDIGGEGMW